MTEALSSDAFRQVAEEYRQSRDRDFIRAVPTLKGRAAALHASIRPAYSIEPNIDSRYLVKGWLDRGSCSVVYGESNVGKTFFALDLALHIAAGEDWHGHRVSQTGVLYIAAEGGRGLSNRIEALRIDRGDLLDRADLSILSTTLDLFGRNDGQALTDAMDCLLSVPGLVIVDTLSRVMGNGDENVAKDMGAVIRNIDYMRSRLGCHVMLIHHSGKDATKGARGSSSLRAAVDTEIELTRTEDVVVAETRKQRDMQSGRTFAYTLTDVRIGTDGDGDDVTSAVVTPSSVPQATKPMSQNERVLWEALQEFAADHGRPNPAGTGWPEPGRYSVVEAEAFRTFAQGRFVNSNPRQAYSRALESLQKGNRIGVNDAHIWAIGEA